MISFTVWCLERYFPLFNDIVAVSFLTKIPWSLARVGRSWVERLWIFINVAMKSPLKVAQTFPKFYSVVRTRVEKFLQLTKNCNGVELVGMGVTIENFLSSMNGISYNNDLWDIILGTGLVDATSDGKQFGFSACYKQSMMDGFGEETIHWVNVRYWCSNVVLDASICNHKSCVRWRRVSQIRYSLVVILELNSVSEV